MAANDEASVLNDLGITKPPVQASGPAHSAMPPAPRLATIRTKDGQTAEVNADYAYRFQGLINDLEAAGYPIHSLSGFAQRNVAGTNEPSYHAQALALDVNPDKNGRGTAGDIPPAIARNLAQKWGFGWGGDFHDSDPMHFSLASHEGGVVGVNPNGSTTLGPEHPAGMTPEEEAVWKDLEVPGPTTPGGQTPGSGVNFTVGGKPMTQAQEKYAASIDWDPRQGMEGSANKPYFVVPGRPLPSTPGAHYVDFDGKEHIVPGGVLGAAESAVAGAFQGLLPDTGASVNRLTGGGLAVPTDTPMGSAFTGLYGSEGRDTPQALMAGANKAFSEQQQDYAYTHPNDRYAQGGRFAGQLVPSIAAGAAVPEIRVPEALAESALGGVARVGAQTTTNALRGVAGTAPTVGTNDAPLGEQLATGALAGAVAPPVIVAAGNAAAAMAGVGGRTTSPEIAALAKLARDKYGIHLRAGQIEGATDRAAAVRDSNLVTAPGSGVQAGNREHLAQFTKGAAKTVGLDTRNLTPNAANEAREAIGSVFDRAATTTGVAADDQLVTDLAKVGSQARELGLDQSQINALDMQIDKITKLAANHREGGIIPGDVYQDWTHSGSSLQRIIDNDHGMFGDLAGDIRSALDDAVTRASAPEDVSALQNARFQWKNLMTLKPLIAEAGPEGYISPLKLRTRVQQHFPNYAFGDGGDLGELARIGQTFMKEPPNSGTPMRLADMFKGAGNTGALGGLALGFASHDPGTGLATAALPFALGASRVARNAMKGWANDNPFARSSLLGESTPVGNALQGFGQATRPAQVPLSALALHDLAFPAASEPQPQPASVLGP